MQNLEHAESRRNEPARDTSESGQVSDRTTDEELDTKDAPALTVDSDLTSQANVELLKDSNPADTIGLPEVSLTGDISGRNVATPSVSEQVLGRLELIESPQAKAAPAGLPTELVIEPLGIVVNETTDTGAGDDSATTGKLGGDKGGTNSSDSELGKGKTEPAEKGELKEAQDRPLETVQRDEKGHVTSITYPNGEVRTFGYDDDGKLDRVEHTTWDTQVRRGDKWFVQIKGFPMSVGGGSNSEGLLVDDPPPVGISQLVDDPPPVDDTLLVDDPPPGDDTRVSESKDKASHSAPGKEDIQEFPSELENLYVSSDGTFSFDRDGSHTFIFPEGNQVYTTKDGARVYSNVDRQVNMIVRPDGSSDNFYYDTAGKVNLINRDGKFSFVVEGEIIEDGKASGKRDPRIFADGTYSYTDSAGSIHTIDASRKSFEAKADGSFIERLPNGQVAQILSPTGTERNFEYDVNNQLVTMTDGKGKLFTFEATREIKEFGIREGKFKAQDGTTLEDVSLDSQSGTLRYRDQDGKIHLEYSSGFTATTSLSQSELNDKIGKFFDETGHLDPNKVRDGIKELSHADVLELERMYGEQTKTSLTKGLEESLSEPSTAEAAGQALGTLSSARLEAEISKRFSEKGDLESARRLVEDFEKRAAQQGLSPKEAADARALAVEDLADGGMSAHQLQELERNLTKISPTMESFDTRFGVKFETITRDDGSKVNSFYVEGVNGEKHPVLETSSDNAREIEVALEKWRDSKVEEIQQRYNVEFSSDGQKDNPLRLKEVDLRTPRIDELTALEEGLKKSEPSTSSLDGRPIKIQFAVQPTSPNDAYVFPREDGQQRILFEPLPRTYEGMRNTILHEWGHNAEANMRSRNPEAYNEWYASMGYREVQDETGGRQWQLKDKDGNYYHQHRDQFPWGTWTRVDDKGRPLREDGSLADSWTDRQVAKRSNFEMRLMADTTPATNYYSNPGENGSESLEYYRAGEDGRIKLYQVNPDLYRSTRKFDQAEIDSDPRYGKEEDGTSKFLRLPDGTIGENTRANRRAVTRFEESLEKRARSLGENEHSNPEGAKRGGPGPIISPIKPHPHTHQH